ncbi:unnamed protein product [Amoebophrya sp. A25]|nr:unnamed protein product [Amoebophrya sp. A25]|eukprot:GSA25T00027355001.1
MQEMQSQKEFDVDKWQSYTAWDDVWDEYIKGAHERAYGQLLIGPPKPSTHDDSNSAHARPFVTGNQKVRYVVYVGSVVVAFVDDQSISFRYRLRDVECGTFEIICRALKHLVEHMFTSNRQFIAAQKLECVIYQKATNRNSNDMGSDTISAAINMTHKQRNTMKEKTASIILKLLTPFNYQIKIADEATILGYPVSATKDLADCLWAMIFKRLRWAHVKVVRVLQRRGGNTNGSMMRHLILWAFIQPIIDLITAAALVWELRVWERFHKELADAILDTIGILPENVTILLRANKIHKRDAYLLVFSSAMINLVEPILLAVKCCRTAACKWMASTASVDLANLITLMPKLSMRHLQEDDVLALNEIKDGDHALRKLFSEKACSNVEPQSDAPTNDDFLSRNLIRTRVFMGADLGRSFLLASGISQPQMHSLAPGDSFNFSKYVISQTTKGAELWQTSSGCVLIEAYVDDGDTRISTTVEKNECEKFAAAVVAILSQPLVRHVVDPIQNVGHSSVIDVIGLRLSLIRESPAFCELWDAEKRLKRNVCRFIMRPASDSMTELQHLIDSQRSTSTPARIKVKTSTVDIAARDFATNMPVRKIRCPFNLISLDKVCHFVEFRNRINKRVREWDPEQEGED